MPILLILSALLSVAWGDVGIVRNVQEYLPIRAQASAQQGEILARLKKGVEFVILEVPEKGDWIRVQHTGSDGKSVEGWVNRNYVFQKYDRARSGTVTASTLNIRSGPGTDHTVEGRANRGVKVEVLGKDLKTGWYQIRSGGKSGYVSGEHLDVTHPEDIKKIEDLLKDVDKSGNAPEKDCHADQKKSDSKKDCLDFDPANYGKSAAADLKKIQDNEKDVSALKKRFIEKMAPIALRVQGRTGFPASVFLAQAIQETGWGRASVFGRFNNIAGHSCFLRDSDLEDPKKVAELRIFKKDSVRFGKPDETVEVSKKCDPEAKRPRSEGAYYLTFETLESAVYAYVHNLLYNPKVKQAYADLRTAVERSNNGLSPNPDDENQTLRDAVVDGLDAYATDPDYQKHIRAAIQANSLDRYDSMEVCK